MPEEDHHSIITILCSINLIKQHVIPNHFRYSTDSTELATTANEIEAPGLEPGASLTALPPRSGCTSALPWG